MQGSHCDVIRWCISLWVCAA